MTTRIDYTEPGSDNILQKKYEELERKHFKQAYWFWIGILIFFFIIVISILLLFFYKDDCSGLVRYIGLVATLLSIVLSIFAIMFTYSANQQMGSRFQEISNAASDIQITSSLMKEELMSLRQRMDSIESRINQMQELRSPNTQSFEKQQYNGILNTGKDKDDKTDPKPDVAPTRKD